LMSAEFKLQISSAFRVGILHAHIKLDICARYLPLRATMPSCLFRAAAAIVLAPLLQEVSVYATAQGAPGPHNLGHEVVGPGRGGGWVKRKRAYRDLWTSLIGTIIRDEHAQEDALPADHDDLGPLREYRFAEVSSGYVVPTRPLIRVGRKRWLALGTTSLPLMHTGGLSVGLHALEPAVTACPAL
jgi:hypothetical protein